MGGGQKRGGIDLGELTINLYVPMSNLNFFFLNLNIIICNIVNWRGEKMLIKFQVKNFLGTNSLSYFDS